MSTQKLDVFKCELCTNVVEVLQEGVGELVCCNEAMKKLEANCADEHNKHFAFVSVKEDNKNLKHIKINHEMTKGHYIKMIEVISNDKKYLKRECFKENELPELTLNCECKEGFYIRVFCNIDGMWITKY